MAAVPEGSVETSAHDDEHSEEQRRLSQKVENKVLKLEIKHIAAVPFVPVNNPPRFSLYVKDWLHRLAHRYPSASRGSVGAARGRNSSEGGELSRRWEAFRIKRGRVALSANDADDEGEGKALSKIERRQRARQHICSEQEVAAFLYQDLAQVFLVDFSASSFQQASGKNVFQDDKGKRRRNATKSRSSVSASTAASSGNGNTQSQGQSQRQLNMTAGDLIAATAIGLGAKKRGKLIKNVTERGTYDKSSRIAQSSLGDAETAEAIRRQTLNMQEARRIAEEAEKDAQREADAARKKGERADLGDGKARTMRTLETVKKILRNKPESAKPPAELSHKKTRSDLVVTLWNPDCVSMKDQNKMLNINAVTGRVFFEYGELDQDDPLAKNLAKNHDSKFLKDLDAKRAMEVKRYNLSLKIR